MLNKPWMDIFKHKKYHEQFLGKKFLAVDLGVKNTGMAAFCPGSDFFPAPHGTLMVKGRHRLMKKIIEIIVQENIHSLIVGVPYALDGRETAMAKENKEFGEALKTKLPDLNVYYQDEALSSWDAQERMKKSPLYNFKVDKTKLHSLAACIILEDFLLTRQK